MQRYTDHYKIRMIRQPEKTGQIIPVFQGIKLCAACFFIRHSIMLCSGRFPFRIMIDIIGWRITPAAYGFRIFLRKISDFQPIVQPRRQICLPSLSLCTVLLFAETHRLSAQISPAHLLVIAHFLRVPAHHDGTRLHDVYAVRNLHRHLRILLHE